MSVLVTCTDMSLPFWEKNWNATRKSKKQAGEPAPGSVQRTISGPSWYILFNGLPRREAHFYFYCKKQFQDSFFAIRHESGSSRKNLKTGLNLSLSHAWWSPWRIPQFGLKKSRLRGTYLTFIFRCHCKYLYYHGFMYVPWSIYCNFHFQVIGVKGEV